MIIHDDFTDTYLDFAEDIPVDSYENPSKYDLDYNVIGWQYVNGKKIVTGTINYGNRYMIDDSVFILI